MRPYAYCPHRAAFRWPADRQSGSVGCPGWKDDTPFDHHVEAGHPLASYAVLEETTRGWQVYFRQIRYDNLAMAEMARANGIPYLADALASGWLKR